MRFEIILQHASGKYVKALEGHKLKLTKKVYLAMVFYSVSEAEQFIQEYNIQDVRVIEERRL